MLSSLYLTEEDEPGLAVGRKLVGEAPPLSIYREENARGFGRLKSKTKNFQQMGKSGLPVLMLTDLDSDPCPSGKIDDWLGTKPSPGFLFRICVREVEAWLLADRDAMATFLGVNASLVPSAPESLADPKRTLITLAQRSKQRAVRIGFKPVGSATIGPDYNRLLNLFVAQSWEASTASEAAPSLARARERLRRLAESVVM